MNTSKLNFIRTDFVQYLKTIDADTIPVFGKMNVQQMIEHMIETFQIASGRLTFDLMTPAERLKPMKDFLLSEKDFRPNTPNALLPDEPVPCALESCDEAIFRLNVEIAYFIRHFEENPNIIITNPFFGDLNFEEWVQLLHKHILHHLRQFGVKV